jgi:hypothetical protein
MLMTGAVVAVLVGLFLVAGTTLAQDKPDGTITFSGGHVSAGIGYSWGRGTLTYKGKKYPFSVDGLAVGAVGGASVSASGDVYKLKKLEDFNGNYAAGTAGATIGGGAAGTAMENDKGVVIKVVSTTQGVDFKLAASGVKIKLKK